MKISTLLWVTISASALDSLNPIAITQQFALQSMVEKKRKIIAFIVSMGLTNFTAGMLVYYGLAAVFKKWLDAWMSQNGALLRIGAVVVGAICICAAGWFVYSKWIKKQSEQTEEGEIKKPKSLSTWSLFVMGIVFCGFELTSALPYFAYLTFLVQYKLSIPVVTSILLLYNLIYSLPLILLLIVSMFFDNKLEKIYSIFQKVVHGVIKVASPIVLSALGAVSVMYGFSFL